MDFESIKNYIYAIYSAGHIIVISKLESGEFQISSKNRQKTEVYELEFRKSSDFPSINKLSKRLHKLSIIFSPKSAALDTLNEELKNDLNFQIVIKDKDEFAIDILNKLTHYLAYQLLLQTELTKLFVDNLTSNIVKTLSRKEILHVTKFYLEGLYIKGQEVEFKIGEYLVRIKSPTRDNIAEHDDNIDIKEPYASILEVETYSNEGHVDFDKYFDTLMLPIQLYAVMDIGYKAQLTHSYFKSYHGYYSRGFHGHYSPTCKYLIENVDQFTEFVGKVYNEIVSQKIDNPSERENRTYSISIALDRYRSAIKIKSTQLDRKITEAVMGLEALYLGDEKETLGFKLKLRVTQVFSILGYNYKTLLEYFGEAYSIRSAFAHGSPKSNKSKKAIDQLKNNHHYSIDSLLLIILRESIILFIFLKIEKKSFIELLNESFVNNDKRNDLILIINELKSKYPSIRQSN